MKREISERLPPPTIAFNARRVVTFGERCTLIRGDCKTILPLLTDIDAIVTDPPASGRGLA